MGKSPGSQRLLPLTGIGWIFCLWLGTNPCLLSATLHPKVQSYSEKSQAHSGLSAPRNSRQELRIWLLRIQNIPAFIVLGMGIQPLWSAQSTSSFREMVSQLRPGFPAGHCLDLHRGCEEPSQLIPEGHGQGYSCLNANSLRVNELQATIRSQVEESLAVK